MAQQPITKTITNFGGRLTRLINGDMDSGFAKYSPSWGYDPFSKPMNLTWLETPTNITPPTTPAFNMPLAAVHKLISNVNNVFILDQNKKLYRILTTGATPNVDSVVGVSSVANGANYLFGASMSYFGSIVGGVTVDPYIYVSNDSGVNKILDDGSAEATVIAGSNKLVPNTFHPLKQFIGKLIVGNGNTIAAIDSTGTSTSSVIATGLGTYLSEINPPLPTDARVQDLDVSANGNYLFLPSSTIPPERLDTVGNDGAETASAESAAFQWNGSDIAITAQVASMSYAITAQQVFLGNTMFFANDSFGSSVTDGTKKLLTLPNNKSPLPNATDTNGNFLVWACPEVSSDGTTRYASLYYFGSLDQENPAGLYRVMRWTTTQANAQVFQVPLALFANAKYQTLNNSYAVTTTGYGKHYIGITSVNTSGTYQSYLLRFLITPTGTGTPQAGVYETQTQLFSKRIGISQVRVYTEPTVANNAFQLDFIGGDGTVITNGTFTYHFGDATDPSTGASSLERINFNPGTKTTYALGVRVTNLGTTNMVIKKIEIDYTEEGK